jgi:hypothetical protein
MSDSLTFESPIHFARRGHGAHREIRTGPEPKIPAGRIPRVAKLMALAVHFESLIRDGAVADYADLARLGKVSRARITQIMNLLLLAPSIQEEVLFLPRISAGRDPVHVRKLQPIALETDWQRQRQMWRNLMRQTDDEANGGAE